MQLSVAERATQAHSILRQSGTVPTNLLAAEIYASWLRCVALGLNSTRPPSINFASPKVLRSEQEERVLLRGLALAEMRTLHDQIAGSNFLIAFATPEGLLLDIVADKSFADTPEAKNIRPGKPLVGNALRHKWHRYGGVPQAPGRRPRQRALFPEFRLIDMRCFADFRPGWFTSRHPRCFVRLRLPSDPYPYSRLHRHNADRERTLS